MNSHQITLPAPETRGVRDPILDAYESDNLPEAFTRTSSEAHSDDSRVRWLVGKFGEAIYAKFLRDNFGVEAGYDLDFGDSFDYSKEADSTINGKRIPEVDVKTMAPKHNVVPILEGVYDPRGDESPPELYVFVSLSDSTDLFSDETISGEVLGVMTPENMEREVEQGEVVTDYKGRYEYYTASECQKVCYPFEGEPEVFDLTTREWRDAVLSELEYPTADEEGFSLLDTV